MTMGQNENDPSARDFEMGRLVQGFAGVQASVNRIEGKLDNVATKADMEVIRVIAQNASDEARRANTRLDGLSPWKQIGVAVLLMFIAGGFAVMGLKT